ncbi:MAG TPA: hypothetical protein V6D12_14065 [Candidatus Obscuribacterales bacterium]
MYEVYESIQALFHQLEKLEARIEKIEAYIFKIEKSNASGEDLDSRRKKAMVEVRKRYLEIYGHGGGTTLL